MPTRLTQQAFLDNMKVRQKNRYDFSEAVYMGSHTPVAVICPLHGVFYMTPCNLMEGKGCPQCGVARRSTTKTNKARARFEAAAEERGYTVVPVEHWSSLKRMPLICRKHGAFDCYPSNAMSAANVWCKHCGTERSANANRKSLADFVEQATRLHNAKYDYSHSVYVNTDTKLKIVCKIHGEFWQEPDVHLRGSGCPRCSNHVSKAEQEMAALLSPFTEVVQQHRINGASVDLFLPEFNVAIEHHGEKFHADTEPFSSKALPVGRTKHRQKEDICTAAGVRLIQIWGSLWLTKRPIMERLLLSAIGKDPAPLVGGRECTVDCTVSYKEAAAFYEANHPQGKPSTSSKFWGLRHKKTGELVACMAFSMSADRRGAAANTWKGASLTRYATSARVPGGASKLLNAWTAANPGVAVMSYSDPMLFAGGLYATLGFVQVHRVEPDYMVFANNKLHHKSAFQRKHIERWRQELGCTDVPAFDAKTDPRTEFEMEDAMGVKRVWNTGIIRWERPGSSA